MRPISLKLKGFTAFRDEQQLDFRPLDLFAICGPTGSGKSSILDAMTYALFGCVDRVGNKVSQLVSHGQPRLAVTFEFAIGTESHRVTRSTTLGGQTKVLLERQEPDGVWQQAGEGADRVREVSALIETLLGLNYEAFTRTVLLPQNRFADFLVGDPKERRAILTDLLGLELFNRMAKAAGDAARETRARAEDRASLLETEYAEVTDEALRGARANAKIAAKRELELKKAAGGVEALAEKWRGARTRAEGLERCAAEARNLEAAARRMAGSFRDYAGRLVIANEEKKKQGEKANRERAAAESATTKRQKAEAQWGKNSEMAAASGKAQTLRGLQHEVLALVESVEAAKSSGPGLAVVLKQRATALEGCQRSVKSADAALELARAAFEDARRSDLVSAVCRGVHKGDPCPVCGSKLKSAPKRPTDRLLEEAGDEVKKAETAQREGNKALVEAQRAKDGADRDVAEAQKEVARLAIDLERKRKTVAELEKGLARAFGGKVPDDPVSVLGARLKQMEALVETERQASESVRKAEAATSKAERALADLRSEVMTDRTRLELLAVGALLESVQKESGTKRYAFALPRIPGPDDPGPLAVAALSLAASLKDLSESLALEVRDQAISEQSLFDQATGVVGSLLPRAKSFEALMAELARLVQGSSGETARALHQAEMISERLVRKGEMEAEIVALSERSDRLHHLALDLRSDRLVAFLQGEALRLLCDAGSVHLSALSDGRYRIVSEEDEFLVVDNWNGEEKRSIHTLSGGETFLASLALALALSEQSRSLAVTEKVRLDSLFLDEGFGTLDTDSLETVISALERLGGDGRMVGVISHIVELADRLPARVVVEKSPRGSRLTCDIPSAT